MNADRTETILAVLQEYLRAIASDDRLTGEIVADYYTDEITFEQCKILVGPKGRRNSVSSYNHQTR